MELTKQAILHNNDIIPGIDGYITIISKIEGNIYSNPDIAIESCRALIEGLCLKGLSLLSEKYNQSSKLQRICKNDFSFLAKFTFEELYSDVVESQLHATIAVFVENNSRSQKIIQKAAVKIKEESVTIATKIAAIRNERGEISHGRNYPKDKVSSQQLARSIVSITDGLTSFMIEDIGRQYLPKRRVSLNYEELGCFNDWLNDIYGDKPVKIDFSSLLYQNAYEKYEEFYLLYLEEQEMVDVEETKVVLQVEEQEAKYTEPEHPVIQTTEITVADFWSAERNKQLEEFSTKENLIHDKVKEIIDSFILTDKPPLRDSMREAMNYRLPLSEGYKIDDLIKQLVDFADELKKI